MKIFARVGLGGRLLAIMLIVVATDFLAHTFVFERASEFVLREDDAERVAEHLIIAQRVIERTPQRDRQRVAAELSTERLTVEWATVRTGPTNALDLASLRRSIVELEPDLEKASLHVMLMPLSNGGGIGGSMTLSDGSVVNFRGPGMTSWSLDLGRIVGLALPSTLLLLLAWVLFRETLKPLRTLVRATSEVGTASPRPLEETGQPEVRHLIRSFNAMQERIHQLLASGSQTLLAIGHDLRTPLSRLQLRIEDAAIDPKLRREITADVDEMRDLLQSLQEFVELGEDRSPVQRIDIAAMAQTLIDNARDTGATASYRGPRQLEIMARPVGLRRALSNLVGNALAYAGNVRLSVRAAGGMVDIVVEDDGPGIPEDRLVDVLRPFIRLDNARARNTAGMGLGLPIVDRVVHTEGGSLHLANRPHGGLKATIRLPNALS